MKKAILSYLSILSLPAIAAEPANSFLAAHGFELMIFLGFALMVAIGLLPVLLQKWDGHQHR